LGGYLLLRTFVGANPDAARLLSPFIVALAALTIGYAAVVALRSSDLRWSAAHLAMVPGAITVFGLAALSPLSIAGSAFSIFTGGLAAGLIVAGASTLTERAQTRSLQLLSGLAPRMPILTWVLVIGALALLGVPLMASCPAETMILFGSFKTQPVGGFALAGGLLVTAGGPSAVGPPRLFRGAEPRPPGGLRRVARRDVVPRGARRRAAVGWIVSRRSEAARD